MNTTATTDGHGFSAAFATFAASCFIITIITSLTCNCILVYTIVSTKKLHSVTHVFIVNLAVSDLITVLGTMPFDVEFMLRGYFPHGKIVCGITSVAFLLSLPSSVLNLTLLTAERFISVLFPFHRDCLLSKRNVIAALLTAWCYTLLVAFFPLMHQHAVIRVAQGYCILSYPIAYDVFQLITNFLLPIILICMANFTLFFVSRRHAANITKTTVFQTEQKRRATKFRKNMKAAKRIALLVGVFLFCWLSYIILVALNISCGICHPRELTWMGNIVNYSSNAINPLLYGLMNRSIRKAGFKILRVFRLVEFFGKATNPPPTAQLPQTTSLIPKFDQFPVSDSNIEVCESQV